MSPRIVLAVLAIVVAALAVGSVRLDSATADEGAHIVAGLVKLKTGTMDFFPEQPPLMNSLSALPLALGGYEPPTGWRAAPEHWTAGHALLYRSGYDARRMLFLARLPTIALFLALCFLVYWFVARESGSRWWGVFAFALTGFCPNLLAHGRLATVDIGATFFMFAATVMFLDALRRQDWRRSALAGVLTACAVLSKTSALLLGPYFLVIAIVFAIRRRPVIRTIVISSIAALVVFEAVYLIEARSIDPLLPFRGYWKNVEAIRAWVTTGHERPQFLLGEFSTRGWPHYFLVAWLLKVPLGAQLLVIAGAVLAVRRRNPIVIAMLGFVLFFLAVSMTSHINLGLRYVLPVFPFAFAGAVISLSAANKRAVAAVSGVLLAWHIGSSLLTYPGYISYFNELIGSHRNADRFLIDSNLDWGQDLQRLRLWADANGVDSIRIDYFGGGDIRYELGDRAQSWPAPRPEPLPRGWFALSRHMYRSRTTEAPIDYDSYLAGSRAEYVTTVGGSILVYRVE
ncbi:MAG TPA: glycosyltransferase family 39 protein [Thermoanaerobaculia bacterium]|nr:glycosyltransferase family 39 protein [Thermoanaerobaculia bacterium]